MRSTIDVPKDLLDEAQKLCGVKTRTATLVLALQRLIDAKRIEDLRSLRGKLKLDIDLERSRKVRDYPR
jgi:Arc/MetJ family transcription regulator